MRPEAAGSDSDDFITDLKVFHSCTNRRDPPGAFVAEQQIIGAIGRIKTQSLHDIPEV
jgi:hypothetical protein